MINNLTNFEIEKRLNDLKPFLEHKTKLGYIAARNTRVFLEALTEYNKSKNDIIVKYGEPLLDEDGNETGKFFLSQDSENFSKAVQELNPYGEMTQEVNIMTIKEEEAIGELSGNDFLELEWLFTPEEKTEE